MSMATIVSHSPIASGSREAIRRDTPAADVVVVGGDAVNEVQSVANASKAASNNAKEVRKRTREAGKYLICVVFDDV